MKKEQIAFILFGEGIDTNVKELNGLLTQSWAVTQMCPMPSAVSVAKRGDSGDSIARWYEPQCVVILERKV